jgi:hypothetical protein
MALRARTPVELMLNAKSAVHCVRGSEKPIKSVIVSPIQFRKVKETHA